LQRFFSLFLLLSLFFSSASFAHTGRTLILNLSDWHAHYENLPLLIQTISYLSQDFLKEEPEGDVVIVINGDFVGFQGGWTQFANPGFPTDFGRLGYEVLALLAQYAHVVIVPGNHDEFDWTMDVHTPGGYGKGLELFRKHHLEFAGAMERIHKRPFKMTAANIVPGSQGADLFEPYTDVPLKNGKKLRFVGGVLEKFFSKTNYKRWRKSGPAPPGYLDLIHDVGRLLPALVSQLEQAQTDGLEGVVFAIHDENMSLQKVAQGVHEIKHLRSVKNPLWIGGHNHTPEITLDDGKHFIQGGCHGSLTRIVLGDGFSVESIENFSLAKQEAFRANRQTAPPGTVQSLEVKIPVGQSTDAEFSTQPSSFKVNVVRDADPTHEVGVNGFQVQTNEPSVTGLRPHEFVALEKAEKEVKRIRKGRPNKVLGQTSGFRATKNLMRGGRETLGTLIAEVLVHEGKNVEPPLGSEIVVLGDIGLFNSSSFRKEDSTPPGPLTSTTLLEWAPFSDRPIGVFFLCGAEVEALFFSLREDFSNGGTNGRYSPQVNSRVREVDGKGTVTVGKIGDHLQFKNASGRWSDLDRSGIYRVTMDPWLANNDSKIGVWEEILNRSDSPHDPFAGQPIFLSILEKHASLFGCEELLKAAGDAALTAPTNSE
jgi:hypothetical protein